MIRDTLTIGEILIGFENTLRIDYKERDAEKIKQAAKQRIEKQFGVLIPNDIYSTRNELQFENNSLDVFLAQISENLKSLALLFSVTMFDHKYGETLADVNYLGFPKEKLISALKFLQDHALYEQRNTFFPTLVTGVSRIDMCTIKRLFCILIVLEDLGIKEGVALISQYLYLGGL